MAQFYRLAGQGGLKNDFLSWIRDSRRSANRGHRITIYICAHGMKSSGAVLLHSRISKEYLTSTEIAIEINDFPPDCRVLVINEACYSGLWTHTASSAPQGMDAMVHAASLPDEPSYN